MHAHTYTHVNTHTHTHTTTFITLVSEHVACALQVCSVLESLEREYRREEDWCSTEKANNSDKVTYMSQLLTKHQEQKEAFLKVRDTPIISGHFECPRRSEISFLKTKCGNTHH